MQGGLSISFTDEAGIIVPLIFIIQQFEQLFCPAGMYFPGSGELIGNGKDQENDRFVILWIGFQDVEAYAFCKQRFSKQSVSFGFLKSSWYALFRNRFKC